MPTSAVTRSRLPSARPGVDIELTPFDEPVPTVAVAAAAVLGVGKVGAIANSLVFEAAGHPLLVLASGAHRVEMARLAERLGTGKIRRATPDFVFEHTGQRVGGVAPGRAPEAGADPSSTPTSRRTRWYGPGAVTEDDVRHELRPAPSR